MHGEELVELLVGQQLKARPGELGAHEERHQPADHEEPERRHEVEVADDLMVGSRQPADDGTARAANRADRPDRCGSRLDYGHGSPPVSTRCDPGFGSVIPRGRLPVCPAARNSAIFWSKTSRLTTSTLNCMRSWSTPQSSAHLPTK